MPRFALILFLAPLAAVAAPVPPETDQSKVARLWGNVNCPPGSYTIKPEGNLLTLRTIGWPVGFGYGTPGFRITREIGGDFDVRVKLYSLDAPNRTLRYEGDGPQTAAGLHIAGGDYGVSLYHWMAVHKNNGFLQEAMQDCVWLSHHHPNGGGGSHLDKFEPGKSLYLRIVRKGKLMTAHTSLDGEDWKSWTVPETAKLPEAVTVGIFVGQTTTQECGASFAEFTVRKPDGWFGW